MTACHPPVNHFIAQYRSPRPWFWRRGASTAHASRLSEDLVKPYLRPQRFTTHGKPYSSTTILSVCGVSADTEPSPHPFYSIHTEVVHACHLEDLHATAMRHGAVIRSNRNLELYCRCREGSVDGSSQHGGMLGRNHPLIVALRNVYCFDPRCYRSPAYIEPYTCKTLISCDS